MRRVKPQEAKNTTETKKGKGRKDKSQGKAEDKDDDSDEEEKKEKKDGQSEGEDEEDEEDEEDDDDDDDDTKTVEFEYYGFLIDLFDEIKQEIEKNGEKFPDYEFKEVEPGPSAVGMFYGGDRLDKGKAEFTGILKEMADSVCDSWILFIFRNLHLNHFARPEIGFDGVGRHVGDGQPQTGHGLFGTAVSIGWHHHLDEEAS